MKILILILLLLAADNIYSQKWAALVVGNDNYNGHPLKNARNDADLMEKTLVSLGFTVQKIKDASKNDFDAALKSFKKKFSDADVRLFYYAGHGIQYNGVNFLVPTDASVANEEDIQLEGTNLSTVISFFKDSRLNTSNIFIIDACRDNPFKDRSWATSRSEDDNRGLILKKSDFFPGSFAAFSTDNGEKASDGSNGNGLYTSVLASEIIKSGLEINILFQRVRIRVNAISKGAQTPVEENRLMSDDGFYFKPPIVSKAPITAANPIVEKDKISTKAEKSVLGDPVISNQAITKSTSASLNDINKFMLLLKYSEAKSLVDKAEMNSEMNMIPELYAIKANIYANLAKQAGTSKENAVAYRTTALGAWDKYKNMDPTLATLKDNVNGPVALYSMFLTEAITNFNSKDWSTAYADFKTSADISDVLIAHRLINMSFDTTSNLYAGASAQNLKHEDDAVMMFKKLSDKKIGGNDNEFLYQYLANYYMEKKDDSNFKKYLDLGKSLYPSSKYFAAIEGDYVRQSGDFNQVVAYYESKIAANPNDYTVVFDLGADIYNYLNPKDTSKIPKGNLTYLEIKMVNAFKKASQIKPEAGLPHSILGNFYYNKAVMVSNDIKNVNTAMKNANAGIKPDKNGKLPPIPKELITEREDLYNRYDAYEDTAIVYYEKAAIAFGQTDKIEPFEKQHYKNAVNYLIELNDEKKTINIKKPAEAAKYAAASKKWSDAYDKIK